MKRKKKENSAGKKIIRIFIFIIFFICFVSFFEENKIIIKEDKTFRIISSPSTSYMDNDLISYGRSKGINVVIDHYGDLEIVDILNDNSKSYDAVWISNSIWLYMLNNSYLTTDSKSIVIDPVVMGIKLSKAKELGFVDKEIYNKDLLETIKSGKLKYVMASVTKTNTGATTYLSFLNSMAGSPEILTEEMLDNEDLLKDLKDFFRGVERVSGDEEYLTNMFLNGEYDAMINYESTLINLNKTLVSQGKEPLYLIYPKDGVAINDMPFAYINNDSKDTKKKEQFKTLQSYLRSDEEISKMESYGFRSWYGGIKENTDSKTFNPAWGIDTSKYLKDMKYPSKSVIDKAINIYIELLRKPTHVVFCLDVSGSMYGDGIAELKDAMNYILNYESASKDKIQFSSTDKITVITFNHAVNNIYNTVYGNNTDELINNINSLQADGGTNIYSSSITALKILNQDNSDEYTKTVILMTDGYSNNGSYYDLSRYYNQTRSNIPIYSITFGDSSEDELRSLANLSNAKVFDGKSGLLRAFKEVRSYN